MVTILCGKSAGGKDTLLNELKQNNGFESIVSTTSRPIRDGEMEGREYRFIPKSEFLKKIENDEFLEYRSYNTTYRGEEDTWYYGCPKDTLDKLDPDKNYAVILDMQGCKDFLTYLGKENCFVCYVDTNDEIRKERAQSRGSFDETEWNRRAKDDAVKFSDEIVDSMANARISNDAGSVKELCDKFLAAFSEYKESIAFRTVSDIQWSPDVEILMDALENVSEEKAAKGMELPLERYRNMTYEERLDYLHDMLRHNSCSDYMLTEVLDMPNTVILPKEVVKEAIEIHDTDVISEYLSDEYGFFHEGFSLSEELEAQITGKELD